MRAAALAAFVLAAAPLHAEPARIDWAAGLVVATGGAAADRRFPGPDIARPAATRQARARATERLAAAAAAVPLAGGGTVGERLAPADLTRVLAGAREAEARLSSDGTVEIVLVAPLEALRLALAPAPAPAAAADDPTSVVVDARGLGVVPGLGVRLVSGAAAWAGPTVWAVSAAAADADPRRGARAVAARASGASGAELAVDLPPAVLERLAGAGALVIVVSR